MTYSFTTYGLTPEEVSTIRTVLHQYVGADQVSLRVGQLKRVILHTVLSEVSIVTKAKVVILSPMDGFDSAIHDITIRLFDVIVVCETHDHKSWFAVGVNRHKYPVGMVEFPE